MRKENAKGQTTIELLIILAISLIALALIYSIYAEQIAIGNFQMEEFLAKNSVQKIVTAADKLAISGVGSFTSVEVEFSRNTKLDETEIVGNTIVLKLSNGTEVFGVSDLNFSGKIREVNGKQKINLLYDGNNVLIYYNDFEINQHSISFSTISGQEREEILIIRNLYSEDLNFYIENNFSHSLVTLQTNPDNNFSLAPNEIKNIILEFDIDESAYGNYSGNIIIKGEINDNNNLKKVNISVEALREFDPLILNPSNINFTSIEDFNVTKAFSICNRTHSDIDNINWSKDGNGDFSNWFNFPVVTSVAANECSDFDINFNVPNNSAGYYDGNITASYLDGEETIVKINLTVIESAGYFFQSTDENTLNADYSLSSFIKRNYSNYFIPTGEIDWDVDKNYEINGEDWDQNLVAYYKFNDTNGTHIFDSVRGNDGGLEGDASINSGGMWGSSALNLDGLGDYVLVNSSKINNISEELTVIAWINANNWETNYWEGTIIGNDEWEDGSSNGFVLRTGENGRLSFTIGHDFSWPEALSNQIMEIDRWYAVAGIFDGENVYAYINGEEVASQSFSQVAIAQSNYPINIGRAPYDTLRDFNGKIDEIKIYNKALTEEEIIADYNSFLEAKLFDSNIINTDRELDWNGFKINSNEENFSGEKARLGLDLNFFTCSDSLCINKTSSEYFSEVDNNSIFEFTNLIDSRYLGFETIFKPKTETDGNNAGYYYNVPFIKDINIINN